MQYGRRVPTFQRILPPSSGWNSADGKVAGCIELGGKEIMVWKHIRDVYILTSMNSAMQAGPNGDVSDSYSKEGRFKCQWGQ
jgi:hypothetical protein